MIRYIYIVITLLLINVDLYSQVSVCRQDTIHIYVGGYRGSSTWQISANGNDWTGMSGVHGDTIQLVATEHNYFRAEIIEGTCRALYSSVIELMISEPPVVMLAARDSACINEQPFFLTGGTPEGGEYWGVGVSDGKFFPSTAGVGLHNLHYRYRDPSSSCADTAMAMIRVLALPTTSQAGSNISGIDRDSLQLSANQPANGSGIWTVTQGTGGRFSDPKDPNSYFFKGPDDLDYTLQWTITNRCGNSSDQVHLGFLLLSKNPCPGVPQVTDADGNVYPTLQIGNQCWMAKNLKVGKYVPSTITSTDHSDLKNNGVFEKYCFQNIEANCDLYGGLYDWDEAMQYSIQPGAQGVCPTGWHVPSNDDWQELDNYYIYGNAGEFLKEGGGSGWEGAYVGDRHAQGEFYSFGSSGFYWSSSTYIYLHYNEGFYRKIADCNGLLEKNYFSKLTGISIRCIKNK